MNILRKKKQKKCHLLNLISELTNLSKKLFTDVYIFIKYARFVYVIFILFGDIFKIGLWLKTYKQIKI